LRDRNPDPHRDLCVIIVSLKTSVRRLLYSICGGSGLIGSSLGERRILERIERFGWSRDRELFWA
jgi:hypothetical protein